MVSLVIKSFDHYPQFHLIHFHNPNKRKNGSFCACFMEEEHDAQRTKHLT